MRAKDKRTLFLYAIPLFIMCTAVALLVQQFIFWRHVWDFDQILHHETPMIFVFGMLFMLSLIATAVPIQFKKLYPFRGTVSPFSRSFVNHFEGKIRSKIW